MRPSSPSKLFPLCVWNDVPGVVDVAVVMAADGVVFMNSYLSAEPALLVEIVGSLVFLDSALN